MISYAYGVLFALYLAESRSYHQKGKSAVLPTTVTGFAHGWLETGSRTALRSYQAVVWTDLEGVAPFSARYVDSPPVPVAKQISSKKKI